MIDSTFVASNSAFEQFIVSSNPSELKWWFQTAPRLRVVLKDSPVWHGGEVVTLFSGTIPAFKLADSETYLVLQITDGKAMFAAVRTGITGVHQIDGEFSPHPH